MLVVENRPLLPEEGASAAHGKTDRMVISALRSCPAHAWTPTTPPPAGGCDVSVEQLWGNYLAIGGSMSLPGFRRCLDGVRLADAFEHDLMALALNEHLLDHGHRFPIPYLCQPFIDETGPSAARWLAMIAGTRNLQPPPPR